MQKLFYCLKPFGQKLAEFQGYSPLAIIFSLVLLQKVSFLNILLRSIDLNISSEILPQSTHFNTHNRIVTVGRQLDFKQKGGREQSAADIRLSLIKLYGHPGESAPLAGGGRRQHREESFHWVHTQQKPKYQLRKGRYKTEKIWKNDRIG